jgi:type IV pilus assembly protein PilN
MADIKINLLPWREELREEKKKEFMNVLMGVVFIAGGIVLIMDRSYTGAIEDQRSRNQYLEQKISILEERIEEIMQLQTKRNQLLSRMQVIQELQGNRPIIVRLFDEIAKRLADRVFYKRMAAKGKSLEIDGIAESNNRVSAQLRNFSDSDWFDKPNVSGIVADTNFGPQASQFHLSVQQTTPKKEQEN